MPLYRYVADKAARALWHPAPVPWEGRFCQRVGGGPWRRNQLVEFIITNPTGASIKLVIVPWRRLRKVIP